MKKTLLCVVSALVLCGCNSESGYENLSNQIVSMEQEATERENKLLEYESVKDKKQKQYVELKTEYDELKEEYDELKEKYEELKEEYDEATKVEIETPKDLSEYSSDITYNNIARTPDDYYGKAIMLKGEVIQLMEAEEANYIRLAVDEDYDTIVLCKYDPSISSVRILEDDIVTVYGISYGITTYESTLGSSVSVPLMAVDHIVIK